MADGTVRGGFELSSEQALRSLTAIRDRGREADAALESLGQRMDRLAVKRVTPTIELRGLDHVNAQLTEIEARLDRLDRRRVTAHVGVGGGLPGGGGGGGQGLVAGGGGSPLFSSIGGLGGALPWWALAAPLAPQLIGGAGALIGSAGAGALGAGAVGLGGFGALAAGGGLTMATARPAIAALGEISKAQANYTKVVEEFGRRSAQAATAQRALNQAMVANPAAAGASRQLSLFQQGWQRATAPARANVYRGVSDVLYQGRRATPTLGLASTQATGAVAGSAGAFASFLADPAQQGMLLQLTGAFARDLPTAERSLEHIATVFMHLSVDALPFFHEANTWVEHWTAGLARQSADQARVQSGMHTLVSSARDWAHLTGAAARDIRDLFSPSVQPGNSMVVSLTHTLDRWDVWLRDNPDRVRQFFRDGEQGVSRIATILSNLAGDVWRLFRALDPILSRAEQFLGFASGLGGGSLLGGAGLLFGAYEGARGALGGAGPSAGGALSAFVFGRGTRAPRLGGGTTVGVAGAAEQAASRAGGGYLMAPAGFQAGPMGALELAAGGGLLMRASAAERLGLGAARGQTAFEQAFGGIPGSRWAMPASEHGLVPLAERGGAVGRLGQVGAAARGAIGGAARIILPLAGIQAVAGTIGQLAQGTSVPSAINRGASGALSTLTLGAVSPQQFQGLFHAAFGADNAGASLANPGAQQLIRSVGQQANTVRTPQDLHALQTRVANVRLQYEMSPQDAAALQQHLDQAVGRATQNAGAYASNTWETAFTRGLERNVAPQRAVTRMLGGMQSQVRELGPRGSLAFARDTAQWAAQLQASNPKLQRPLDRLMRGIVDDINQMNHDVGTSFKDLQGKVFWFNGQILTGAQTTWGQIRDAMVNPSLVAQEKLSGIWGAIQREAIDALTQMGYSRDQARTIVTQTAKGGQAARNANFAVGLTASGTNVAGSATFTPISPTAPAGLRHTKRERGGEIPGTGLLDTVNLGGARVAPGEAWIANRHTMADLSSATLEKYGKTAWQIIRDESRPHSAPMRQTGGLFGGLAGAISNATAGISNTLARGTGAGWVQRSHPELHPGIARAVEMVLGRFPLSITSTTSGGHASGSYHYLGEAADIAGASGTMFSAAQWINSSGLARSLTEGIHNPNLSVKYGRGVSPSYWGPAVWGEHANHIHMAVAGALGRLAGGGGGGAIGMMPSALSLRAPRSGLGGIPGALTDQASRMYAAGLQQRLNAQIGASGISAAGWSGGGSNVANQQLGHRMMLAAGWGEAQWPALQALWSRESGWSSTAVNPTSGAAGIAQSLGHGPVPLGNAPAQIAWGLNYIRGRYGSPAGAMAHEQASGWYQRGGHVNWAGWNAKGGSFVTNGPTMFGAGERSREQVTITPVGHGTGRQIVVNMHGVTFHGGDKQQLDAVAEDIAGRIIDALDRTDGGTSDAQLAGATS